MDNPPSPGGILPLLRAETGQAHQQLEDAVDIGRRLSDPAGYREILEVFLGFYRPLEARLWDDHDWQSVGLDPSERCKTSWLEGDLHALGVPRSEVSGLPVCEELPPERTFSQAFGCLYVLEGATLGGRHISAMMANSTVPPGARRFFAGYGEHTGERWREFIAALERHAAGAGAAQAGEIIQGARETFGCLHRWYVRQCPTDALPG